MPISFFFSEMGQLRSKYYVLEVYNMEYEALGRRVRQQRKLLKMTQEELAAAADVSTSYIGHIERGLKRCSLETLIGISNALNVTPDILLQDSLNGDPANKVEGMSATVRSMLNDIAKVLREYDLK